MSRPEAIEVIVLSAVTSETKASGKVRKVTFLLPNDGDHPFSGMIGEHLHIVLVRIPDEETPVGAGQDEEADSFRKPHPSPQASPAASSSASRKEWADLPPSQQAAMRCGEHVFGTWLARLVDQRYDGSKDQAARIVRRVCGIESRKELDTDQKARVLWHQLDRQFLEHTGRLAVAR